jgi:EAL domain-containing protein (putative c-di-GMP-specific phosphodiesterase class I)
MRGSVTSRVPPADGVEEFRLLLRPGAIRAVFQPIVRLTDRQPIGYEGLARFRRPAASTRCRPTSRWPPPGASESGRSLRVACWRAISEAGAPPSGRLLFVNVAPDALRIRP